MWIRHNNNALSWSPKRTYSYSKSISIAPSRRFVHENSHLIIFLPFFSSSCPDRQRRLSPRYGFDGPIETSIGASRTPSLSRLMTYILTNTWTINKSEVLDRQCDVFLLYWRERHHDGVMQICSINWTLRFVLEIVGISFRHNIQISYKPFWPKRR